MQKLIVGNWKMNPAKSDEAAILAQTIARGAVKGVEWLICPPFPFLSIVRHEGVALGGQNCANHDGGAHTGEVSAAMLAAMGCTYVILGHSERRQDLGETNDLIYAKVCQALKVGLTPIICVGETAAQRSAGQAQEVVATQLAACIPQEAKVAIAYEPLWAIGTGTAASLADISAMHGFIHEKTSARLLYGGSVTPDNARDILATAHVDGVLVGGASLIAEKFLSIGCIL